MAVGWSPAGWYWVTSLNGMPPSDFWRGAGRCGRQASLPSTSLRPWRMICSSALTVAEMPTVWAPSRFWPGRAIFFLPGLPGTFAFGAAASVALASAPRICAMVSGSLAAARLMSRALSARAEGTWPKPAWPVSPMPPKSGRSTELALDLGAFSDMPVAAERVTFFSFLGFSASPSGSRGCGTSSPVVPAFSAARRAALSSWRLLRRRSCGRRLFSVSASAFSISPMKSSMENVLTGFLSAMEALAKGVRRGHPM